MNKNKKSNIISGEEHYTNLMLIVVAEAMVLLITQLLIYNGYTTDFVINKVVKAILVLAAVVAIVSAVLYFCKKKSALIALVFSGYMTLLMLVIRFIPNSISTVSGAYCNTLRGQKLGVILSVVYVVAGILYCILAEKRRRKLEK